MSRITSSHHVLGIKHLLSQLWNCESSVLLGTTGSERSKSWHEEVESGEWNHVDRQLPEVSIQLSWKSANHTYLHIMKNVHRILNLYIH